MRLRAILFAGAALAVTGVGAWQLAVVATDRLERASAGAVEEALGAAGQDWASVTPDGTLVTVAGTAPDEASRFRAVAIARQVLDPGRIVDHTEAEAADPLAPPPFTVEFLRNDGEVSLIGLAPEESGHELIRRTLSEAGLGGAITDMLETTTIPAPDSFRASLAYGLQVLASLPRARVTVGPDRVGVTAVVESVAARAALDSRLRAGAPEGLALDLQISAPKPVIAPFRLAFTLTDGAATLATCSAETDAAAEAIRAAAGATGAPCAVGLGAPTVDWPAAAEAGIAAVQRLGGGRFELVDVQAVLAGPEAVTADAFDAAATALRTALPRGYGLSLVAPKVLAGAPAAKEVPEFAAIRDDSGRVTLQGAVGDPASQAAIGSYATAVFGADRVQDATVVDSATPKGWPVRVLAGLEALAAVKEGRVAVTPDRLRVEGSAIDPDAAAAVEAVLAAKAVGPTEVAVRYDAAAARAASLAARPAPELCAEEVGAILTTQTIGFAPGSAEIDPASQGVIAAIADVLRSCPGAAFEVAGHTDASGNEASNLRLSEERAQAVAAALEGQDLPLIDLRARGYGAGRPLASNDTPDGRLKNRRIEIVLRDPEAEAQAAAEVPVPAAAPSPAAEAAAGDGAAPCVAAVAGLMADSGIAFALGAAEIAPESAALVREIAAALGQCPGAAFEIGGHTDDRGGDAGNQRLSERRAEAVRAALAADGATGVTLTARGYGESRPRADNATAEGRAANRRIEITAVDPATDAAPEPAGAETGAGGNG